MRTEPRAQLHKPVTKNFLLILRGAPAPGAPPCLRHWSGALVLFILHTKMDVFTTKMQCFAFWATLYSNN